MVVTHTSTLESHAFNPSTRDVEMGSDMAEQREEYKVGRERNIRWELKAFCQRIVQTGHLV